MTQQEMIEARAEAARLLAKQLVEANAEIERLRARLVAIHEIAQDHSVPAWQKLQNIAATAAAGHEQTREDGK